VSNPISDKLLIGTIGELFVQLKLLQFHVQAAPPLKDSGNDLIACRGEVIKTIQVKTTTKSDGPLPRKPGKRKKYGILALVKLDGHDNEIYLDRSNIYLVSKSELESVTYSWEGIADYKINQNRIERLFNKQHETMAE
jgi:hypothetical protein